MDRFGFFSSTPSSPRELVPPTTAVDDPAHFRWIKLYNCRPDPVNPRDAKEKQQTRLVKAVEEFFRRNTTITDCLFTLQWLLGSGDDVESPSDSDMSLLRDQALQCYVNKSMRPVVDHLTEMLKWSSTRKSMDNLCLMVDLVCEKGAIVDLYQDYFFPVSNRTALRSAPMSPMKQPDNAVEIAILPHCPPSFLSHVLKRRQDKRLAFTSRSKLWRRFGYNLPRDHHRAVTNLEWVVTRLYQDLLNPTNWRAYTSAREIADMLDAKVALLIEHKAVDAVEKYSLVSLSEIFRLVQTNLDIGPDERFEQWAWYHLCMSVSQLAEETHHAAERLTAEVYGERRHRFVIMGSWDPRFEWIRWKTTDMRPEWSASAEKKAAWEKFLDIWHGLIKQQGEGLPWHKVEKDNWFVPFEDVKSFFKTCDEDSAVLLGM